MFNVTYEIITPESAACGDAVERGFVCEGVSLREAIDCLGDCAYHSDSSPLSLDNPPRWFTNDEYGHGTRAYFEKAREESRSLHLPRNITPSSAMRIARLLGAA